MSKIWSFLFIISIISAFVISSPSIVIEEIMNQSKIAVENVITLIGMMCFWNGIFNIFEKTNAINVLSKKMKKIILIIFNKQELDDKAIEYMSLNICTNILGVGNAATINGIKSMEEMQKNNKYKDKPSNNMTTFMVINSASLQLIPTSMIALRSMYNSANPASILVPVWIVTICALLSGLMAIKILNKRVI